MADRIKGITIEIGGSTDGLSKALEGVNKDIRSTQRELKDVERLLKLDPTNTELLEQRQRLLAKSVEQTSKKLDELKKAEKEVQQAFERGEISQEQYDALKREIIATEQQLEKLEDRAAKSSVALSKIGTVAGDVADGADQVANKTRGISTAAAGAITAIGALAVKAAVLSDDLNTLANQTGFSTEEIQKMQYAADRIDVELDTITKSAAKMTKNLTSTSKEVSGAWERLGISIRDSNGELRNSTDIFYETIEALSQVQNETERDTLAMTLFGKSANELAGIVDDGGAALRALGEEAEQLGLILDQETLDELNEVNDILDKLKAQTTATLAKAGAKALKALTPVIEDVADAFSDMLEYIADLDEGQIKFALSALGVIAVISPLASVIAGIGTAIKGVTAALAFLNANPIIAAATAVTALGVAIVGIANDSKVTAEAAENLFDTIEEGAEALSDSITEIDATEDAAGRLIDRLDELNKDGLDEDEVGAYNATLKTLLDTVPELSSLIDEQTGEIEGGTDALRKNTDAWAKNARQQAYHERLTELYKAEAEAQIELEENTIALEDANRRLAEIEQERSDLIAQLDGQTDATSDSYFQLETQLETLNQEYTNTLTTIDACSQEIEQGNTALTEASAAVASTEAAINSLSASEAALTESQAVVTESTNAQAEAAYAVGQAWAVAYQEAKASIDSQVGLFDTFETELDEAYNSLTELTGAMDQQAQNMTNYANNLQLAAQYGIDEGLIASLSDGSVESAAYIAAIIGDIEEAGVSVEGLGEDAQLAVDNFNAAYERTEEARDYLALTISGMNTDLDAAIGDGETFGRDLIDGMISGMENEAGALYSTITRIVGNAISAAKTEADSHSPSKRTIALFEDVGEGMIVGLDNKEDEIVREVRSVVDHALSLDPRNLSGLASESVGSYGAPLAGSNIHNSTRTVNVTMQNTFGSYDRTTGAAAANDLLQQVNRALGRAY